RSEDYGVPLGADLEAAIAEPRPDVVVDLSDEPVLGPRQRLRVAARARAARGRRHWLSARALAAGAPCAGADFRFEPPAFEPFALPSLTVIGTGKRVGKTAVTGHLAALLARDRDVVVAAMGRGGPAEPEVIEAAPSLDDLLALSRSGRHAASDHLEIAALAGVPTIGCRRCGGGLARGVAVSKVVEGARPGPGLPPGL